MAIFASRDSQRAVQSEAPRPGSRRGRNAEADQGLNKRRREAGEWWRWAPQKREKENTQVNQETHTQHTSSCKSQHAINGWVVQTVINKNHTTGSTISHLLFYLPAYPTYAFFFPPVFISVQCASTCLNNIIAARQNNTTIGLMCVNNG